MQADRVILLFSVSQGIADYSLFQDPDQDI